MIIPPPPPVKSDNKAIIIVLSISLIVLLACVVTGIFLAVQVFNDASTPPTRPPATITTAPGQPTITRIPTRTSTGQPPTVTAPPRTPLSPGALETLQTLFSAQVPINDPRDIYSRLKGVKNIPETIQETPKAYKLGDELAFWVVNDETDEPFQITAVLIASTDHLYLWADKRTSYKADAAQKLADTFENKIYPTDRKFFGSEWTPGIDNDAHLYVVLARGIGNRVAGYFSSADSVHPLASPHSNGHEMFVLNAASFPNLSDEFIYSVLAHEFQHMIHWYRDRNEESWMNEGFSELAAFLNGYGVGGHDFSFSSNPDIQLNDWPNDKNKTLPHYGASFLFVNYFLNRFGDKATQAVVANTDNDLESIDEVLASTNAIDGVTKKPITADDVFTDWTLANYLGDKSVGDGRFVYANYPQAPKVKDTEKVSNCPSGQLNRTVSQYGADYIRIACRGDVTINFTGVQEVGVLPVNPHGGNYAFWSNKGDESDMTLTHSFDFSALSGAVTMNFWTWYDLEKNYDYVYLVASVDGENWEMVPTTTGTKVSIGQRNLGIGYNDTSKGWIQENVDLSKYAGKKVQIRFEYLTDAAVNGEGFLVDDMSIPQINYSTNFETDNGGWEAKGFVRVQNRLPQTYRLSLIRLSTPKTVQYLTITPDQTASVNLTLDNDVVLVVSGTTRFTRQPASYTISIK